MSATPHYGPEEHINDSDIVTQYVANEPTEDGEQAFEFVCKQCGTANPCKGDPLDFANRPFACRGCGWVSLLSGGAIQEFVGQD